MRLIVRRRNLVGWGDRGVLMITMTGHRSKVKIIKIKGGAMISLSLYSRRVSSASRDFFYPRCF